RGDGSAGRRGDSWRGARGAPAGARRRRPRRFTRRCGDRRARQPRQGGHRLGESRDRDGVGGGSTSRPPPSRPYRGGPSRGFTRVTMPLALFRNDDQAEHVSPGHPERPDRVVAILEGIASDPQLAALPWLEPAAGHRELPLLVHSEDEVRRVEAMAAQGGGWFDPDT